MALRLYFYERPFLGNTCSNRTELMRCLECIIQNYDVLGRRGCGWVGLVTGWW
jgi:hypothetical protein